MHADGGLAADFEAAIYSPSQAAYKNYKALLVLRILLGILEASSTPGFILIVCQWWKRDDQAFMTGVWCACNALSEVFGAAVAYGIVEGIKNSRYSRLAGLQLLLLFTGVLTVICGILFLFMVPDSPSSAWFLSREEKILAFERIRANQQGTANKVFRRYQLTEAHAGPKVHPNSLEFQFQLLMS